ncbi:hypothetical protein LOD99_3583 [Oopsacas minuta]|uniref:TBC domain-containing protein kinase-like protein n=1 Tax=Oopsacas minuta TaxID=111878 RepID=A0AAV7JXB7_9METZ|nr:hypothetical protein LOD99_3583 [Oopsacas minuta]
MSLYGDADIGILSFFATNALINRGPVNGVSLVPTSINIVGRFQKLKGIRHPNLCQYIWIQRCKQNRMLIVSEYHQRCLENKDVLRDFSCDLALVRRLGYSIVSGLVHMNELGLINRNLSSQNVQLTSNGEIKMSNFGMYYVTEYGEYVKFPIGIPVYWPPELIREGQEAKERYRKNTNIDIWSLGIILMEALVGKQIWSDLPRRNSLTNICKRILHLTTVKNMSIPQFLFDTQQAPTLFFSIPQEITDFLVKCLNPDASMRPCPRDLLEHPFLKDTIKPSPNLPLIPTCFESTQNRTQRLDISIFTQMLTDIQGQNGEVDSFKSLLGERDIHEVFFLWSLAGGDLLHELEKNGLVQSKAPICSLPQVITKNKESFGKEKEILMLYTDQHTTISMDKLNERLNHLTTPDFYPLLILTDQSIPPQIPKDSIGLPASIKEKDVEYQFHRVILFRRLLESYPHTKDQIKLESKKDICPLFRSQIWAALLDVKSNYQKLYDEVDKESESPIDRQIEVDIPRCHQYNEFLASSEGHSKLKRLLKAFLNTKIELVYWQGLDSLAATFLVVNFHREAIAYASMLNFIDKYVHNFFLKDNSPVMQEYLAVFSQLIAFHAPQLYNHLFDIGFQPELYAIPWFLTVFTHVFPLEKIFLIWNKLLVNNSTFPLFIGLGILWQLKSNLLTFGFNDCILLFSDLPDINIDKCMEEAEYLASKTPATGPQRQYAIVPLNMTNPVPLEDKPKQKLDHIKNNKTFSISGQEMVELLNQGLHSGKVGKKGCVVIDIRPVEDFQAEWIPDSVNMPFNTAFNENGLITNTNMQGVFEKAKKKIKVIVGKDDTSAHRFAGHLITLSYTYICVLYGGKSTVKKLELFRTKH